MGFPVVLRWVMFDKLIFQVFSSCFPEVMEMVLFGFILNPIKCISMVFDIFGELYCLLFRLWCNCMFA